MELDKMKALWAQYDKNLQNNAMINEKIMRHVLMERSSTRLRRFTNMEHLSLILVTVLLAIFVSLIYRVGNELQVIIPYIASIMLFLLIIGWGLYKLQLLNASDFHTASVTETMERVQKLQLLYAREKVWSIALLPLVVCCIAPVIHHWIWGGFLLNDIQGYLPKTVLLCLLGMVFTYWIYRSMYAESIRAIFRNLEEIANMKKPE